MIHTESLENWRARQLLRSQESRTLATFADLEPAPSTVEELRFTIGADGRVFWNRLHVTGNRDFFPSRSFTALPSAAELRGQNASSAWRQLYFIAAEILYAVVEADMTLTPAYYNLSTPPEEIAANAKAVSELFTPRFAKSFLAPQTASRQFSAATVIDWIGQQPLEAAKSQSTKTQPMELMAA
jgi:hypothetical protein